MSQSHELDFTYEFQTDASAETVWAFLTDPQLVKKYHLASLKKIGLQEGGEIIYGTKESKFIVGRVTKVDVNKLLEHTFRFVSHTGTDEDAETLVRYEIIEEREPTVLRLTHTGFHKDNQTRANMTGGWPFILDQMRACLDEAQMQH